MCTTFYFMSSRILIIFLKFEIFEDKTKENKLNIIPAAIHLSYRLSDGWKVGTVVLALPRHDRRQCSNRHAYN